MSVSRPPIPVRLWLREQSLQAQLSLLAVRHNQPRNRPFHSTPRISFAARRSRPTPAPATRRAQRGGNDSLPVSKDGLMVKSHLHASDAEIAIDKLTRLGQAYWHYAKQDGILSRMLPQHVFARVGGELISRAYSEAPSEISIRSISTDVDMVYRIGYVISKFHPPLFDWLLAACTRAGSKSAILTAAARFLKMSASLDTLDVSILRDVKRFARVDKDPRAIVLYAMVLSRQERETEALALLRPVLEQRIFPSKEAPPWETDILLRGAILPPWKVFMHSAQVIGNFGAMKKAQRIAALEYRDPEALVPYAYGLLEANNDFDQYEQLMCEAATAGNASACLRLGNFYYLMSLNLHPITLKDLDADPDAEQPFMGIAAAAEERFLEERAKPNEEKQEKPSVRAAFSSFWTSLFGTPRSKSEYRDLARDWYILAHTHGNQKASLLAARLAQQEGQVGMALDLLAEAEKSKAFAVPVRKLRHAWLYAQNGPKLADSWLNV